MRPYGWAVVLVTSIAFFGALAAFVFADAPEAPAAEALGPEEEAQPDGNESEPGSPPSSPPSPPSGGG